MNNNTISAENIIDFYTQKLRYYKFWATHHRITYWITIWTLAISGISLGTALFFKFDTKFIMINALILNAQFIICNILKSDEKYARYRTTEIELQFTMQALNIAIRKDILNGETKDFATINNIQKYHPIFEKIMVKEFKEHFAKQKTFKSIKNSFGPINTNKDSPL
ncbi:hypothetical protein [Maridesulfovibrio sp.]|uniref:hypothetical protein n=1 Tax=Maridesulfovibrio sp. TaxID=2795000 RepID=UPI002A18E017|nr:hypothetical protein [Maridesulfovibrio sp.]